jgi:twitching motility two-component system response regulator PilH
MSRVLIIDDVETDRQLMGRVVAAQGHQAEFATDGEEGLSKAKSFKPALILLDVVMPKSDGFATCRKLKKDPETATIPVVMVSSKAADSDRVWAMRQGASAYVIKPFTPDSLKATLASFV